MSARSFAARLLAVRDGAPLLEEVPSDVELRDVAQAYVIADLIVDALEPRFGRVVGYKVGATSLEGQKILALSEPFYGRVLEQWRIGDGHVWELAGRPCSVEPEVGFVMAADLPTRVESYSSAEVFEAIARVIPLLEINAPSYARPFEVGGLCLIADNGVTQGIVTGEPGVPSGAIPDLAAETVTMSKGGSRCAEGHAGVVLGDPLNAVMWLANALRAQGRGLRAGDVIASGAMARHIVLAAGDHVVADYATLGRITLNVAGG